LVDADMCLNRFAYVLYANIGYYSSDTPWGCCAVLYTFLASQKSGCEVETADEKMKF